MQYTSEANSLHADPLYLTALASLGVNVPAKLMAAPSKGSIAVLPFVDLSGEAGHEHFTDGLTEDIITDLSNVPGFFVIARNSVFAYKGKPSDVRQIAHDLGVKFILEGSARRAGQRLRINVQLIDAAEGGNHIWAERFDRELADIFEVQDEVTRRVVEAITGKLATGPNVERYRPANLEAYDLCVRSRNLFTQSKMTANEARTRLERAIALDPNYAEAHWQLALVLAFNWINYGDDQIPNRGNALSLAERAVELDPKDSSARWVLGYVQYHEHRWEEAAANFEASLRQNPNDADAHSSYSDFKLAMGNAQEAVDSAITAMRLNPHPPGWYFWDLGNAQVAVGQYEEAITTLRREETYRTGSRKTLAVALALLGRNQEAIEEAQFFLASNPQWNIGHWKETHWFRHQQDMQFWVDAFRLIGLPE